jgi:hypothetical protein
MPSVNHLLVLPTSGCPYIKKTVGAKGLLKDLQDIVGGFIEGVKADRLVIHPMFCEANPRWAMAERLLRGGRVKRSYYNEEGARACCGNMAVLMKGGSGGGCPHVWGDVVMVLTDATLRTVAVPNQLKMVGDATFHPDTEEEAETKRAEWAALGYDVSRLDEGQVFLQTA